MASEVSVLAGSEFLFDAAQLYRAQKEVNRLWKYRWLFWLFAIGFPTVMFVWGILPNWGRVDGWYLFINMLPWLLLSVFFLTLIPVQQRRAAKRLAKSDPTLRGIQRRFVDDAGLHMQGSGLAVDLDWSTMARIVETAEFFLFFYNERCAYYIPKSDASPGAIEAMRATIRNNAPTKARLLDSSMSTAA